MRVDAHQHFWSVSRGDYGWLQPSVGAIYRDFAPRDLEDMLARHRIDRTIVVQAAPTTAETEYMLGIADSTEFVGKVVGWINFEIEEQRLQLENFAAHPKFAGIRPMVQDIPDPEWMHRPDIAWAYDAVRDLDLTIDALGFPAHAAPFLRLLERYPGMRVVIDHCLKPQIRDNAFDDWAASMTRIAENTGACCKLSGIVTEAGEGWTVDIIRPYAEHIVSIFGADRVMWGSDWPVVNLAAGYDSWIAAAEAIVTDPGDREKIFGATAAQFYRL